MGGVGFKFYRGNELRAVGRAHTVTFKRDTGAGTADSVSTRVLAAPGRQDVDIDARRAEGNIRSQEATASGGVHVVEAGGMSGATESARLDGRTRSSTGDEPVEIVGDGYRILSQHGFRLNLAPPGALELIGPTNTILGGPL
jgi:hypothetical protein